MVSCNCVLILSIIYNASVHDMGDGVYVAYNKVSTNIYLCSCLNVDASNKPHHLCLVAYYVPDGFHPQPVAHGNSKHKKPFYPTLPSTMAKIREVSKNAGPKRGY